MALHLQTYPYKAVEALLPQRKKDCVTQKIGNKMSSFGLATYKGDIKNWFPCIVALGVIALLGGIFLTLAAHQILPHGVNAISNLGVGGKALGYCIIGLGTITAIIGAVKTYRVSMQNSENLKNHPRYECTKPEMESYFSSRLKRNEIFVVDNAPYPEIMIFYKKPYIEQDGSEAIYPHGQTVSYSDSNPQKAFEEWCDDDSVYVVGGKNRTFAEKASYIDLHTLSERVEAYENQEKK